MKYTFKLLAALLDYPTDLTQQIVSEMPDIIKDCKLLDEDSRKCVMDFARCHSDMRLLKWQEEYSAVFDITPVTSLYLFEHIYGDSRKRGAAMSSLKDTYTEFGLKISNDELPDYLPVYLDFISTLDDANEAMNYLADISEILKSIHSTLEKHGSDYALLIKPLISMAAGGKSHPLPDLKAEEVNCPLAH